MRNSCYLAIDIGASSGRHILGWLEDGQLCTKEIYRFPNGMIPSPDGLVWDLERLLMHVKEGIDAAQTEAVRLAGLSIDTWGVDYVLMNGDTEAGPCFAYRNDRTNAVIPLLHELVPFHELYRRTGTQFQPFNSIYQLFADSLAERLKNVTDFLMIPEYLMFKLCGSFSHEYTNATTTGLVSADTGEYDAELIKALGLPSHLFHPLQRPGSVIGDYKGIPVTLCATHDTGSAVEGIDMAENFPYISSGTWSLLGVKTDKPLTDSASESGNWSNEGGVGYNRYQKNIMGMWVVNRLREELCPDMPFDRITAEAEGSGFDRTVPVNDSRFLAPESMKAAFEESLGCVPESPADYFRCAFRSLASSYREALEELENNTGRSYDGIYIVGGGAKNGFLNRLTSDITGKKVIAIPKEMTAIGNLKIQMRGGKSCLT